MSTLNQNFMVIANSGAYTGLKWVRFVAPAFPYDSIVTWLTSEGISLPVIDQSKLSAFCILNNAQPGDSIPLANAAAYVICLNPLTLFNW